MGMAVENGWSLVNGVIVGGTTQILATEDLPVTYLGRPRKYQITESTIFEPGILPSQEWAERGQIFIDCIKKPITLGERIPTEAEFTALRVGFANNLSCPLSRNSEEAKSIVNESKAQIPLVAPLFQNVQAKMI